MKFRAPFNQGQALGNGLTSLVSAALGADGVQQQAQAKYGSLFATAAAHQAQARKLDADAQGQQIENQQALLRPQMANDAALDAAGAVGPLRQALGTYRATGTWGAPTEALSPEWNAGPVPEERQVVTAPAVQPAGVNPTMIRNYLAAMGGAGLAGLGDGKSNAEQTAKAITELTNNRIRDGLIADPSQASIVGAAQAAIGGKKMYSSDANGAVLNDFTGDYNTANPMAQSTIFQRNQAGEQSKAGAVENLAQAGAARAAASNSFASAALHGGQLREVNQRVEQGAKGTYDSARGVLVDPRAGTFRPVLDASGQPMVPKADGEKPMTEGQAKANLFGTRMKEANAVLEDLAGRGVTRPSLLKQGAEAVPMIGTALGMAANATASGGQQMVEQAQRDFINAVLRRESGAAIAPSEFANAAQQYFPQPNDKPETLALKKRARQTAIDGLLAEVPQKQRMPLSGNPTGGATGSWADAAGSPPPAAAGKQRNVTVAY